MSQRQRLPDRRPHVVANYKFESHPYTVTFSRYPDGRLAELFLDCHKPGTALQANATALGRLASLCLQHGVSAEELVTVGGVIAAAINLAEAP